MTLILPLTTADSRCAKETEPQLSSEKNGRESNVAAPALWPLQLGMDGLGLPLSILSGRRAWTCPICVGVTPQCTVVVLTVLRTLSYLTSLSSERGVRTGLDLLMFAFAVQNLFRFV